ncbi:MAG: hypothetical protein ACJ739_02285 [Acidimicrobiales bacterium]
MTEAAPVVRERTHHLEIFAISLAGLLLEVAYTRVISFKLFYYYTYFVVGLALLGIGSGAVAFAVSKRLQRTSTDALLRNGLVGGSVLVGAGYLIAARIPVDTRAIWDYGTASSFANLAALLLVCLTIYASFLVIGVLISAILGRAGGGIGRLYFADLAGAALACLLAVPLLNTVGSPSAVFLAGSLMAATGAWVALRSRSKLVPAGVVLAALLFVPMLLPDQVPLPTVDGSKTQIADAEPGEWNAVFRVDPAAIGDRVLLFHDGLAGSAIYQWDGDVHSLSRFDDDIRSFPFSVKGSPDRVLLIGAAGGHEVLASLYYRAAHIDAVELNPVTHRFVEDEYADYSGRIAYRDDVDWLQGDGRSFLSRTDNQYDMIWYPAPDSYAASNASTAGAFVLSESYLYTVESINESFDHLHDDGLLVAQFGEWSFAEKPNRTSRYVSTAREALAGIGVDDPSTHVVVIVSPYSGTLFHNTTILVKKEPFTDSELQGIAAQVANVPGASVEYQPGTPSEANPMAAIATLSDSELDTWYDDYEWDVRPVTDDGPFFWHFSRFSDVVRNIGDPLDPRDVEDSIGERVLLLLLGLSLVLGVLFLLAPFLVVRKTWVALPAKGRSATYFAALGLGFMLFEISLIQRLTLFLGYPTYSLTVTLAALLVFTGVGAALSPRTTARPGWALPGLAVAIVLLTAFYLWGLPAVTDAFFDSSLPVRVAVTFLALAPLGLCLGTFMPFGLTKVASLTDHPSEYVAWGWAVNGFASVVGATLTTVIAMTFGFNVALGLGMVVYLGALLALRVLLRVEPPAALAGPVAPALEPELVG